MKVTACAPTVAPRPCEPDDAEVTRRFSVSAPDRGQISILDLGDPSRAPEIIFVHANGFNAATYQFLLGPLARDHRILAPDLRGHGRSGAIAEPEGHRDWRVFRDDLIALIDVIEGPPLVLAGHSMGAVSALMAAERRPDRVRSVLMIEPVILPRPAAFMMTLPLLSLSARRVPLYGGALRRRRRFDSREAASKAYRGRGAFKGWPEQALQDYVAEGFRNVADGVELICAPEWEAANYAAQGHDPWPVLRRITRPVRILKGGGASTCSLENGRIPGVNVGTVPGGNHFLPMLEPNAVQEALQQALDA